MQAVVEHHALGAPRHCGISYFRSGRQTAFGEGFKHLRGPDDRDMRSFAEPKYLLLNLSHSLETDLNAEITSGYHHGKLFTAHRSEQNLRQSLHGRAILDLENDAAMGGPQAVEFVD